MSIKKLNWRRTVSCDGDHSPLPLPSPKRKRDGRLSGIPVPDLEFFWKTINNILHRTANRSLPTSSPLAALPQLFDTDFSDTISKLHFNLQTNPSFTPALPPSPLLYSTLLLLSPYSKSTTYSLNHLSLTVISIMFLPPY